MVTPTEPTPAAHQTARDLPAATPIAGPRDALRVGDWRVGASLGSHRLGPRWLAWSEHDPSPRVLCVIPRKGAMSQHPDPAAALEPLARFVHPHAVGVEALEATAQEVRVVSPFSGSYDGLMALGHVLTLKPGGQMPVREAVLAGLHVLSALDAAARRGIGHGPLSADDVLVDRRGRAMIELLGVEAALLESEFDGAVAASLKSASAIVYELVTGVGPAERRVPASRLVRGLPKGLDVFIERGLTGGFGSPAEAAAMLQTCLR